MYYRNISLFDQLDNKSLKNCRETSKSWKKCIDSKNLLLVQFTNIPTILHKQDSYLNQAARSGQWDVFEIIFERQPRIRPRLFFCGQKKVYSLVCQYR